MIKRIFAYITLVIALILLVSYMGSLLNPDFTDGALNAVDAFHELPEDSMDVIVYGSSHAWKGVDTLEMYEEFGIRAYNYGCNWQHMNTTSLFISDSLRSQTPEIIMIETYKIAKLLYDVDMNGEIYYTRNIPMFTEKREYLKQCFGKEKERYLSYFIPLIMFHQNWSSVDAENFNSGTSVDSYIKNRGYSADDTVVPTEIYDYSSFKQKEIGNKAKKVLDQIVDQCAENNIKIIFFTVPYKGEYHYGEAVESYAKENDCVYIDLFQKIEEVGIDADSDFRDKTHLNNSGAKKVAHYLGNYIIEHFDIGEIQ